MQTVYEVETILDEAVIDSNSILKQTNRTTLLSGKTTLTSMTLGNPSPTSTTSQIIFSIGSENAEKIHQTARNSKVRALLKKLNPTFLVIIWRSLERQRGRNMLSRF